MPWSAKSFWTAFRNNSSPWFAFPLRWLSSAFWPVKHSDFSNVIVTSVLRHRGWERGVTDAGNQVAKGQLEGAELSWGWASGGLWSFETPALLVGSPSLCPKNHVNPTFTWNEVLTYLCVLYGFPVMNKNNNNKKPTTLQTLCDTTILLLLLFLIPDGVTLWRCLRWCLYTLPMFLNAVLKGQGMKKPKSCTSAEGGLCGHR